MGSTRATRMATASARSTSTRWKGPGRCCAPGCARTGASRRTSCRSISASSSSCTTPAVAAEPCLAPSPRLWSGDEGDEGAITPDPDKSHAGFQRLPRPERLQRFRLPPGYPYLHLPVQFAAPLRGCILEGGIMDAGALEEAIGGCEWDAADHRRVGLSVVVMQVCGRKRD